MSVYSIAVSGLTAQSAILGARAQNIANAGVTGRVDPKPGERKAYAPIDPVTISRENGVAASFVERDPASVSIYDPDSVDANEEGVVAYPNVNLEEEIVGVLVAKNAYIANAKVISVQRDLDKELLDILA